MVVAVACAVGLPAVAADQFGDALS